MAGKPETPVPDAWDDDWETAADKPDTQEPKSDCSDDNGGAPLSKKEKLKNHREANRKLWKEA
jgi:hypothetical protein